MSRIALAANGFERRLPNREKADDYWAFPGARLSSYLERDVVPAVDELLRLPGFRGLAAAPFDMLDSGSESPVLPLIEALKSGIRATIDDVLPFVDVHGDLLNEFMEEAVFRWRRAKFGHVPLARPDRNDTGDKAATELTALEVFRLRLRSLRQRCGDAWVSGDDYFGPFFEVHQEADGKSLQRGEFIVAFSDELSHVGNFVARCLLVRSTTTLKVLQELSDEIRVTFVAAKRRVNFPWIDRLQELSGLNERLRSEVLFTEPAALTEAAMALVQIHAEFSAAPPAYDWLPVAHWIVHRQRGLLRHALESKRDSETAEQIAHALQLVREWCDRRPSRETELEAAVACGGLVVDEGARQVYWESQLVPANWHKSHQAWNLLRRLALIHGRSFLCERDFYNDDKVRSTSAYAGLKNKLQNMLPAGLRRHIVNAPGGGGYRLDLESAMIRVFKADKSA